MGLLNWSPRPELNGVADPLIPAMDGASARGFPALVRGVMAEVARHASDQGGALKTAGLANAFTVSTASGVSALRNGLRFIVRPDRTNTDAATLNVDGTGPKPWLDASGVSIVAQGIVPEHIMAVTYDADLDAWRSDGALAIRNEGLAAMPPATLKGNGGLEASAPADLTVAEVRELLEVDHLPNKSEEEMVAAGPIADALGTKATPANIADAISPISQALEAKASTHYVDRQIEIVGQSVTDLANDVEDVQEQVTAIASGQSSGAVIAKSWAALSAVPPNAAGARAEVIGTATTTHPDPVAAGNPAVPDPGTYRGSLSPLGWERIGPTTASAAADQVGESITTSPLARAPLLQLAFRDPDTKRLTVLSPADSAAFIQEIAVPPKFPFDLTGVAIGATPSIILPEDPLRVGNFIVRSKSDGELGFNFSNRDANFAEQDTWPQEARSWANHGPIGTKAISAIVRGASTADVSIRVFRSVNSPPPKPTAADLVFSKWTEAEDPRFKAVIRQEIQYLIDNNIYGLIKGWWMVGASKENFRVNLANPSGALLTYNEGTSGTPIVLTPHKGIKGNGIDQHIGTGILPADAGMTVSDHFMMQRATSDTIVDNSGNGMGNDGNFWLQSNRSPGLYGSRSGPGTDTNVGNPKPLAKWQAMSRDDDAANYGHYIDGDLERTNARALPTMAPRQINLLAGGGVVGVANRSALEYAGFLLGPGLAGISITRLTNSMKRIDAVRAQIAGA